MRIRLRPAHSPERLKEIYAKPHDHMLYGRGHGERVEETIKIGRMAIARTIADLSCGNAAIANALKGDKEPILGDIAPGYPWCGSTPMEHSLTLIPNVDLYICSETLEHLDDPDLVLRLIRKRCFFLLLSTPVDNFGDTNEEHYWSWSKEDVEEMCRQAGFIPQVYSEVDSTAYGEPYKYGIWLLI